MWSQCPPNGPKRPDTRSIWSTRALVCQLLNPHTCSRCLGRVSRIPAGPQAFQVGGGESPTPHGLYSHCPCARSQGLCRCPGPGQSHRSSPRHFLTARCFGQPGLCGYTRGRRGAVRRSGSCGLTLTRSSGIPCVSPALLRTHFCVPQNLLWRELVALCGQRRRLCSRTDWFYTQLCL